MGRKNRKSCRSSSKSSSGGDRHHQSLEAVADYVQNERDKMVKKGDTEAYEKIAMMDTMTLSEQKKYVRAALLAMGTNCELNDSDPTGNGDQSPIQTTEARQAARDLYASGGDIHAHMTSHGAISSFSQCCSVGLYVSVKDMIMKAITNTPYPPYNEELKKLLETRETSMRLSPLLMIVSAGKNVSLSRSVNNHVETAKILLKYGANPYAQDVLGKTVVHYGAGSHATSMTLKVVDMCIHAAKSHHLVGQNVQLFGLKNENFNERNGIVGGYDHDSQRRSIYVPELNKEVWIKPQNMRLLESKQDIKQESIALTDVQDRVGSVSLMEVIMTDREDVAEFLLKKHKTSVHTKDWDGISCFKMSEGFGMRRKNVCRMVMDAVQAEGAKNSKEQRHNSKQNCFNCKKGLIDDIMTCSACKTVVYCGKECQRSHWTDGGHKQECKKIQAAANGVKLDRPKATDMHTATLSFKTGQRGFSGKENAGYKKPRGVKVGEKFTIKVQGNIVMPILVYDETRTCEFQIEHGARGFDEIMTAMRKEPTWMGRKAFMKASFDENGDCTVYPDTTGVKNKYSW